ncbi:N-acetyltransferase [Vibrio scophthalmi]|uniref:GNAT family N-acetyltransferase n=1 Tax=Vibrio scophthalmi TaxID=45658 RepID=UPI003AAF9DEB
MQFSVLDLSYKQQIKELFQNTFTDSEGAEEGEMIGHLAYELVDTTAQEEMIIVGASDNEALLGCVIFTKFTFVDSSVSAYLLSPAAVATATQKRGIGQKLIEFGLDTLKANGAELVVTYGDPSFYGKVGFAQITELQVKAPLILSYPHGWLGQKLDGSEFDAISGETSCVAALDQQKYW